MDFNMKRIIYTIIFSIGLSVNLDAQNNLSFSQPLLITSGTVPAGKVWKLEGLVYSDAPHNLASGSNNNLATYKINGTPYPARKSSSFQTATSAGNGVSQSAMAYNWEMSFPLWFPAGTLIEVGSSVAFFSILEFSIDPQ